MRKYHFFILALIWLFPASVTHAEDIAAQNNSRFVSEMDTQVQDLKKEILELNRDLFILEEELLFPANTQVSVFLSMEQGPLFNLDSVQLQLNAKVVTNYLYTEQELKALARGGVQRLYIGNLSSGEHELVAFFTGKGPKGRDYRRGTTLALKKGSAPKFVELKIVADESKQQPVFTSKVWE